MRRFVWLLLLIVFVAFIFYNSSMPAAESHRASELVGSILTGMGKWFGIDVPQQNLDYNIRKLAHFCEYALEGFLLMLCLRVYTRHFVRHMSWPILGGLLTALTDETIQLFSPGRSSQVLDVWLDFVGVLAGLLVGLFLLALCRMCALLYKHRNED